MLYTAGYTWVCLHSGLSTKSQPEEAEHSAFSQNPLEVLNVTITNREIERIKEKKSGSSVTIDVSAIKNREKSVAVENLNIRQGTP